MNLFNTDISYRKKSILEQYPDAHEIKLDDNGFEYRFSIGLQVKRSGDWITWGRLPSGRYVFLSHWQAFPLRQLI
jgi:hypothetical protein